MYRAQYGDIILRVLEYIANISFGYISYCFYFKLFCKVWVCECVGVCVCVMCGCVYVWVL